jgi:hypothetical protein
MYKSRRDDDGGEHRARIAVAKEPSPVQFGSALMYCLPPSRAIGQQLPSWVIFGEMRWSYDLPVAPK